MSRLNLPSLSSLTKDLFGDHPNMPEYNLIYEIMEDLIPSDSLLGDSDEDFTPDHFAGLVMDDTSIVFTAMAYTFYGKSAEPLNMLGLIESLPGIAVSDPEKLELIAHGAAKTVAAVAARSENGVVTARLYWHPGIDRLDALGFIKSAADMVREAISQKEDSDE